MNGFDTETAQPSTPKELELAARLRTVERAMREICDAAEALSRPGVVTGSEEELVLGQRMSNAVMAAALLVGHTGIYPELSPFPPTPEQENESE